MDRMQFKLPIGAKRQVTLPRAFMEMLSLEEGGELLLEVVGDHATLTPIVSIPRTALPEELRLKFEARRGLKASDITLAEFMTGVERKAAPVKAAVPERVAPADEIQMPRAVRMVQENETR